MHEDEPGWFYVGNGQLRFKDGDNWTDQYHELDKPKADPTEKNDTSTPEAPLPERSRLGKRIVLLGSAAVVVILVAVGVYFVALRPLPTSVAWASSVSGIAPGGYLTVSGVVTPAEKGRQILFESASGAQGPWQ
ncbi:MAG: hypothetical protein QOE58_151, partial [Actinomycetota bacterium]|nr:hypothetical protein [Actinomycetota bacterium]